MPRKKHQAYHIGWIPCGTIDLLEEAFHQMTFLVYMPVNKPWLCAVWCAPRRCQRLRWHKQRVSLSLTQLKNWESVPEACAVGSTNMMNMERVRFQATGTHSLILIKKLQRQNEELRMENELLRKLQAFLKQKSVWDISFCKRIRKGIISRRHVKS